MGPKRKAKNFKGNSPNVEYLRKGTGPNGSNDLSEALSYDLAAGRRLAARNSSMSLDGRTMRLYETRLMHLEEFARSQGDSVSLCGPDKRPFMATTVLTFLRKYLFLYTTQFLHSKI